MEGITAELQEELISYLSDFITEDRWQTLNNVLEERTKHLCVVLEDIYQPHNASAVLRSCDCFGVQDIHIIENEHDFRPSKAVTIGADRWLTLHKYANPDINNTEACFSELKKSGYRIIGASPHHDEVSIDQLPVEPKTALVFGAELNGLSQEAKDLANGFVKIPIYGFSESYNISVSAALCLYEFTKRMRSSKIGWGISEKHKMDLRLDWLQESIRASDQLTEKFLEEKNE